MRSLEGERTHGLQSMCFTDCDSDYWTVDESVYFYQKTLEIDQELGLTGLVSHETHRNRALFTPYATKQILLKVPEYV